MKRLSRSSILLLAVTACFMLEARGELCDVNVCENGGTCVSGLNNNFSFKCICLDGFAGIYCNETETGPCHPNPCKNDAPCEVISHSRRGDVFSEYVCKCPPGYDGVHCEINKNECASTPCKNGGVCLDLNGDYSCKCPPLFLGKECHLRCISKLGMEGGAIENSQITASSVYYGFLGLQRWGPELARLNNKGMVNAWTSATSDVSPYIQVNLQRKMWLTGIITQGASRVGCAEYMKAYKVAYSLNGRTFTLYKAGGQNRDKIFPGNNDNDGKKANMFDPPIIAQYLRVLPVVCRKACTLRMELVGCEMNGCSDPLGLKSHFISDQQFKASSVFKTWGIDAFTWHPHYARLDKQGKTNAWTALSNNRSEWLQVDFLRPKKITGIITQGAKDFGTIQYVSAFKVGYSDDGENWTIYKDEKTKTDKVFPGNSDNNSHKKNVFDSPVYARFVRIMPWTWNNRITLRMELLGCEE
ncbi:milk fat globule EGF and factor V/VIII domain containing b isoform X2 [Latimeria chalumnae]|uniref:milk fat globule EGF and factor V/VIII domain containing b isoform X2 n=1 Tax=Latimeria chalumnae TaxID=7897 RepID=UPI00313CE094